MQLDDLLDLYVKERKYQKEIFGDFKNLAALNTASLLLFLRRYLEKAEEEYAGKWSKKLPPWLITCRETEVNIGGSAPIRTYEHLIKVFALAGAVLEAFCDIDVNRWREEGIKDKWKKGD